jgi:signal transduction histidine kinase
MYSSLAKSIQGEDLPKLLLSIPVPALTEEALSPKLPRTSVDAHEVLGRVVRECHSRIGSKGLRVSLRLLSRQYHVSDDGERLRQVYTNLLNNAVANARPGSKITLRATCPSDCALRIEVEERSPWREKLQAGDLPPAKKRTTPVRGHR